MRTYDIAEIASNVGAIERDYTVRQFDCTSMAMRIHTLVAVCDADAVDLACIMIGVNRAEVWQHGRFVYEIGRCEGASRAAGEQPTE